MCAPPPGFSQLTAAFLAVLPHGIRPGPSSAWPYRGPFPSSYCFLLLPSLAMLKTFRLRGLLEIMGLEPMTPGLQSRCSSQLS